MLNFAQNKNKNKNKNNKTRKRQKKAKGLQGSTMPKFAQNLKTYTSCKGDICLISLNKRLSFPFFPIDFPTT